MANASLRYRPMLSHELERVNEVVEFSKEVEWREWEDLFTLAMRKTNTILLADSDGNYWSELRRVDVSRTQWFVLHGFRKCEGLRDLGNLQDITLESCLDRCLKNPLCRSATYSFSLNSNSRCFLSSLCVAAVADFDYRFVLWEKRWHDEQQQERAAEDAHAIAEWTPRLGHEMVNFGGEVVVLGGHGVAELALKGVLRTREVDAENGTNATNGTTSTNATAGANATTDAPKSVQEETTTHAAVTNGSTPRPTPKIPQLDSGVDLVGLSTTPRHPVSEEVFDDRWAPQTAEESERIVVSADLANAEDHGFIRKNLVYSYLCCNKVKLSPAWKGSMIHANNTPPSSPLLSSPHLPSSSQLLPPPLPPSLFPPSMIPARFMKPLHGKRFTLLQHTRTAPATSI